MPPRRSRPPRSQSVPAPVPAPVPGSGGGGQPYRSASRDVGTPAPHILEGAGRETCSSVSSPDWRCRRVATPARPFGNGSGNGGPAPPPPPRGARQFCEMCSSVSTGYAARRTQKSSKRPLSLYERRAMMALAPSTVQCIPGRLRRVPIATLQPASTTPEPTHSPCARNRG